MKKTLIAGTFLLFSIGWVNAQQLQYGLKAGPQLSSYTRTNDAKAAFRYHLGVFGSRAVTEQLSVQAEALFSAQGINRASSSDFKMRTLYLNVPLLAHYQITERISAHAGLQAGFLLSAKLKVEGYDVYDRKAAYKPLDLAFSFGGEYRFCKNIGAGLRFNLGLTTFHREDNEPHQRTVQLFAAYHLR